MVLRIDTTSQSMMPPVLAPDYSSRLTPSSSLRSVTSELGIGHPAGPRDRSGSSTSSIGGSGLRTVSGSLFPRTPLVGLPSPGIRGDEEDRASWGTFSAFDSNRSVGPGESPPLPPKPQGRKTMDFFASPITTSAGPSSPAGSLTSSRDGDPLPPPPLKLVAGIGNTKPPWGQGPTSASTSSQKRGSVEAPSWRLTSSPLSSRDPSPTPSSHLPLSESRSRSRTDDFFSSFQTVAPASAASAASTTSRARDPAASENAPRSSSPTPMMRSSSPGPLHHSPSSSSLYHREGSLRTHVLAHREAAPPSRLPTMVVDPDARPSRSVEALEPPSSHRSRDDTEARSAAADAEVAIGAILTDPRHRPPSEGDNGLVEAVDSMGLDPEEYRIEKVLGVGAFSRVVAARRGDSVYAVKMIARSVVSGNERFRSSVGRELGVLRHISHPSIVALLTTFPTPHHTALVLECADGGELFDLLMQNHAELSSDMVQRIVGEVCAVVDWMHQLGVVHRDIKLESKADILLTRRLSPSGDLPPIDEPLIKLTDFGLSRFIDPASPLLTTRCGSEEYAAPELLLGRPYDGRSTDAWAVGVVFYAVVVGSLPFASSPSAGGRKTFLMRIAKAEYDWIVDGKGEEKDLVAGLLQRDPKKRSGLADVWRSPYWGERIREGTQAMARRAVGKRPVEGSAEARLLAGEHSV